MMVITTVCIVQAVVTGKNTLVPDLEVTCALVSMTAGKMLCTLHKDYYAVILLRITGDDLLLICAVVFNVIYLFSVVICLLYAAGGEYEIVRCTRTQLAAREASVSPSVVEYVMCCCKSCTVVEEVRGDKCAVTNVVGDSVLSGIAPCSTGTVCGCELESVNCLNGEKTVNYGFHVLGYVRKLNAHTSEEPCVVKVAKVTVSVVSCGSVGIEAGGVEVVTCIYVVLVNKTAYVVVP